MSTIPTSNAPIDQTWFGIWYHPLADELNPALLNIVQKRHLIPNFIIPKNAQVNPEIIFKTILEILNKKQNLLLSKKVYLFIPGTKFDQFGTRHGRGGGWYDRLLAQTPREWLRIGICKQEQWSTETLIRQPWDQPMDYVFVE